jgi:hypothetical protein
MQRQYELCYVAFHGTKKVIERAVGPAVNLLAEKRPTFSTAAGSVDHSVPAGCA